MGNIQTSKRKYQTLCRWPRTNSYDYQWESVLYTCWIYEYWDNQVWNEGTMNYLTTLFSYRFLLKITLPSRITNLSATCIDHIFVRIEDTKRIKTGDIASGLLFNDITDHLPCFISIKWYLHIHYYSPNMTYYNLTSGSRMGSKGMWCCPMASGCCVANCNTFH